MVVGLFSEYFSAHAVLFRPLKRIQNCCTLLCTSQRALPVQLRSLLVTLGQGSTSRPTDIPSLVGHALPSDFEKFRGLLVCR